MFKTFRIFVLLLILFCVSVNSWLTRSRSTDWNDSLYVKVYPINADGSRAVDDYINSLSPRDFEGIEEFIARETERYGHAVARPVRMELGEPVAEQPPALGKSPSAPKVMWWSLKLRWWAGSVANEQDRVEPDVRIFVRYHEPREQFVLEDSVGLQKGMVGIVNALASRHHAGTNNVVIAHEFLHTLGATDKYHPENGAPFFPSRYAEPDRHPRFPQRHAEIMGGRIALSEHEAVMPGSLKYVVIGEATALEIRLQDAS
jgi:hypothetical protein